jgi:hypothetical protein
MCEAQAYGASEKVHGTLRSQLPLDDETMRFNGAHTHVEEPGDLLIGITLHQVIENLALAF